MIISLQNLTPEKFKKYGEIIAPNPVRGERFQVIIDEPVADGWRIAVSQVNRDSITKLGIHPNTRETFEPLTGISVIVVASYESPEEIEAFLLDQPVCLYKNVWHATVSLSEISYLKILENSHVEQEVYTLENALDIRITSGIYQ